MKNNARWYQAAKFPCPISMSMPLADNAPLSLTLKSDIALAPYSTGAPSPRHPHPLRA